MIRPSQNMGACMGGEGVEENRRKMRFGYGGTSVARIWRDGENAMDRFGSGVNLGPSWRWVALGGSSGVSGVKCWFGRVSGAEGGSTSERW
jgi:hypothetical protein